MRERSLLLIALLLMPAMAHAAYQNPIVVSNERQANGSTKLTFQFSGNAGEPVVTRVYTVIPTSTATILRNWIDATINELDLMHTAASLPALQNGQTVPRLAPVTPTRPPKSIWIEKTVTYARVCGQSYGGAVATACTALKSDIESTYAAGFLNAD